MPDYLTCPQGHTWYATTDQVELSKTGDLTCPTCVSRVQFQSTEEHTIVSPEPQDEKKTPAQISESATVPRGRVAPSGTMTANCPHCRKKFELSAAFDGKLTRCPHCEAEFRVNAPADGSVGSLSEEQTVRSPRGQIDDKTLSAGALQSATNQQTIPSVPDQETIPSQATPDDPPPDKPAAKPGQHGPFGELSTYHITTGDLTERSMSGKTGDKGVWDVGDVIMDLYEVKKVHEAGGMGLVYRAHHREWNVDLAVKSPRPAFFRTEDQKANFETECETWINLGLHPNIVSCYYVRRFDGIPRVFAEYVEGGSLKELIDDRTLYEGGHDEALLRILDIAIQFAWGLEHSHEQGLVHQDVKPANVMMASGIAKVTDFGLAKARAVVEATSDADPQLSREVTSGGMTPAYCSIEQSRGQKVSTATDVWSWGLSVLAMFTGGVVWSWGIEAPHALAGYKKNIDVIPPMPRELIDFLQRCFQENPAARPATMNEVASAVQSIYEHFAGKPYPNERPKAAEAMADSLNNRAMSLLDLGHIDQAEDLFEQALQRESGHRPATFNLGLLRWRSGKQTDRALLDTLQSAGDASDSPELWARLRGVIHLERGEAKRAVKELKSAVTAFRDDATFRRDFGVALIAVGRFTEGADALESAVSLGADDDQTQFMAVKARHAVDADDETILGGQMPRSRCLHVYEGAWGSATALKLSSDGRRLALGVNSGQMLLWKPNETEPIRCKGHSGALADVVFYGGENNKAITIGADKSIRSWDATDGRCRATLPGPEADSRYITTDDDGSTIVLGGEDGRLYRMSQQEKKPKRFSEERHPRLVGIALIDDGRLLTAGGTQLIIWDVESGERKNVIDVACESITCFSVSGDFRHVLYGSSDGAIGLIDLTTAQVRRMYLGHLGGVTTISFMKSGRTFMSAGHDRAVRLWALRTGKCIRTLGEYDSATRHLTVATNRNRAAWAVGERIERWRIVEEGHSRASFELCRPRSASQIIENEQLFDKHMGAARRHFDDNSFTHAYTEVRAAMVVPGFERSPDAMKMLDDLAERGRRRAVLGMWERASLTSDGHVTALAIADRAPIAVAGHTDGRVSVWDLRSGSVTKTVATRVGAVRRVALSPSGELCAVAGQAGTISQIDIATGIDHEMLVASGRAAESQISSLNYSANATTLAATSRDGLLGIWNAKTHESVASIRTGATGIHHVCLSHDGRFAAVSDATGSVVVWSVEARVAARRMEHKSEARVAAFSSGGGHLFVGCQDGSINLWSIASSKKISEVKASSTPIDAITFTDDGAFALVGSLDGTIETRELPDLKPAKSICAQAGISSSVVLPRSANMAMTVSAKDPTLLSMVELDWELRFPSEEKAELYPTGLGNDISLATPGGLAKSWAKVEHFNRMHHKPMRIAALVALLVTVAVVGLSALNQGDDDGIGLVNVDRREPKFMANLRYYRDQQSVRPTKNLTNELRRLSKDPEYATRVLISVLKDEDNASDETIRQRLVVLVDHVAPPDVKVPVLLAATQDSSQKIVDLAIAKLTASSKQAASQLATALNDADEAVTMRIVESLAAGAGAGNMEIESILRSAMKHQSKRVQLPAAFGVARATDDPEPITLLTEALDETRPELKIEAANNLGHLKTKAIPAVPKLEALLTNTDPHVRTAVIDALGLIEPVGQDALVRSFASDDNELKQSAMNKLASSLTGIRAIVRGLDTNVEVVGPAVRKYGAGFVTQWLDDHRKAANKAEVPALLAHIGHEEIAIILEAEKQPTARRQEAATLLSLIPTGAQAAPSLAAVLVPNNDEALRLDAARAIEKIGAPAAAATTNALVESIKRETSDAVRQAAADALIKMDDGLTTLQSIMQTAEDGRARTVATAALGRTESPSEEIVVAIGQVLTDQVPSVRLAAAQSLLRFGEASAAAINALVKSFADETDQDVRRNVAIILGNLTATESAARDALSKGIVAEEEATRIAALAAINKSPNDQKLSMLMNAITSDLSAERLEQWPGAFSALKDKSGAGSQLFDVYLKTNEESPRRAALAQAIRSAGVAALKEPLLDERTKVRDAAAAILIGWSKIKGGEYVLAIDAGALLLSKHPDASVRIKATKTLGTWGSMSMGHLVNVLREKPPAIVARSIIAELENMERAHRIGRTAVEKSEIILGVSVGLKHDDPTVKLRAMEAMIALDDSRDEFVPPLIEMLGDANAATVKRAIRVLGGLGALAISAEAKLVELEKDERFKEVAEDALRLIRE